MTRPGPATTELIAWQTGTTAAAPTEITPLAAAGDPATAAAIRPVAEREVCIHGGDVRGAGVHVRPGRGAPLIACNVYLRYLQIAVVEGGPRLGDPEAGTVASLTSTGFSIVSGGVACIAGRPC